MSETHGAAPLAVTEAFCNCRQYDWNQQFSKISSPVMALLSQACVATENAIAIRRRRHSKSSKTIPRRFI